MAFAHLHVHTEYSLLDGSNKIKEYVKYVKELGMDSAAITDHGVMYGVIDFYKAAKEAGINPVIGCEVYVAPHSRFDRELTGGEDRYYHLVLLAENNVGYANLVKIVSKGFTEGYYYKPRVDMELLEEYHEGLIALSACLAGELSRRIRMGDYDGAKAHAVEMDALFGRGNYYLELQDHGLEADPAVIAGLVRIHEETGIPLVCTNDAHYIEKTDARTQDILMCIQTGKTEADPNRMRFENDEMYIKSEEEKLALIEDIAARKPDVVFVAMGSPRQELLMEEMLSRHQAVYQGLGGSFDVYTGRVKRAPVWWQEHGLEWLYRLINDPSRIKRQIYLFWFLWKVRFGNF